MFWCLQNQFLAQLRQRHMEQQMHMTGGSAAPDLARQQELQQRVLASMNPQQLQQLQALPKVCLNGSILGISCSCVYVRWADCSKAQ